jgi:hypothetical protein
VWREISGARYGCRRTRTKQLSQMQRSLALMCRADLLQCLPKPAVQIGYSCGRFDGVATS